MRLFVAIDVDEAVRRAIGDEQKRLARAIDDGGRSPKWIAPEQLHLTLAFVGDADETQAAALTDRFSDPVPISPFSIACGGLGVFPPRGAPQVLWLAITEGASHVTALQREVADRIAACGLPLEKGPFHAHL